MIPPISPKPTIGANCRVMMASGKLKIKPTIPPFTLPGTGKSILNIINPMANLLIKDAMIARFLSSNDMKNIGAMETIPKIVPAISPLVMLVMLDKYEVLI